MQGSSCFTNSTSVCCKSNGYQSGDDVVRMYATRGAGSLSAMLFLSSTSQKKRREKKRASFVGGCLLFFFFLTYLSTFSFGGKENVL